MASHNYILLFVRRWDGSFFAEFTKSMAPLLLLGLRTVRSCC
jgi:hypothetical protein